MSNMIMYNPKLEHDQFLSTYFQIRLVSLKLLFIIDLHFSFYFLIEVLLIYYVVLISSVQQSDSIINIFSFSYSSPL